MPEASVKGHTVFTNRGRIDAENIVFATHYPFVNLPGFYFLRQHQERSYVLAVQEICYCLVEEITEPGSATGKVQRQEILICGKWHRRIIQGVLR